MLLWDRPFPDVFLFGINHESASCLLAEAIANNYKDAAE